MIPAEAIPPGRDLDVFLERFLFGRVAQVFHGPLGARPFSGTMDAAWSLVERLVEWQYVKVRVSASHFHGHYCSITAPHESQRDPQCPVVRDAQNVWGVSAPHAICLAVMSACGADGIETPPDDGSVERVSS